MALIRYARPELAVVVPPVAVPAAVEPARVQAVAGPALAPAAAEPARVPAVVDPVQAPAAVERPAAARGVVLQAVAAAERVAARAAPALGQVRERVVQHPARVLGVQLRVLAERERRPVVLARERVLALAQAPALVPALALAPALGLALVPALALALALALGPAAPARERVPRARLQDLDRAGPERARRRLAQPLARWATAESDWRDAISTR